MLLRLVGLDPDREGACDRGAPSAMRPGAAIVAAIGGGLLFGAAGIHLGAAGTEVARVSILGATLCALAYCDVAEHRIPNRIVVPASAICAALLFAEGVRVQHLLGGLALVALMLGLSLAWPASFGMGDVKLALPRPRSRGGCDAGACPRSGPRCGVRTHAAARALGQHAVSSPGAVPQQRRSGGGVALRSLLVLRFFRRQP